MKSEGDARTGAVLIVAPPGEDAVLAAAVLARDNIARGNLRQASRMRRRSCMTRPTRLLVAQETLRSRRPETVARRHQAATDLVGPSRRHHHQRAGGAERSRCAEDFGPAAKRHVSRKSAARGDLDQHAAGGVARPPSSVPGARFARAARHGAERNQRCLFLVRLSNGVTST